MAELLLRELSKKALEVVENVEVTGKNREIDPLRPMRNNLLEKYIEAQAVGPNELREAELKFKEATRWLERKEINPDYLRFRDCQVNCGSCAFALWRRLNGEDLDVKAVRRNVAPHIEDMELLTGLNYKEATPESIEEMLRERGPGSHAIVAISRNRGSGHWFNVGYDGKRMLNMDAQDGTVSKWPRDYGDVRSWGVLV